MPVGLLERRGLEKWSLEFDIILELLSLDNKLLSRLTKCWPSEIKFMTGFVYLVKCPWQKRS